MSLTLQKSHDQAGSRIFLAKTASDHPNLHNTLVLFLTTFYFYFFSNQKADSH